MRNKCLLLLTSAFLLVAGKALAIEDNYVEVDYNGTTATVTVAGNISEYVTVSSGNSSHVKLIQSDQVGAGVGEITYKLTGSSDDGEFYVEGSYKSTLILSNLTLHNPAGPAVNVQNGKRIDVSITNGTTSNLSDGQNADYNGCFHSKGHTEFKGKGTLNIVGNSKHAIYSKEYLQMKNCTINVKGAVKDGVHCQQYFLMESGTLNIQNVQDDGVQVELRGTEPTGEMPDHETPDGEEEDSGNFYQDGGTIAMTDCGDKCIKTYGIIKYNGGVQNFDKDNTEINARDETDAISHPEAAKPGSQPTEVYTLDGRRVDAANLPKGIYIVREGKRTRKICL